jgi:hypothetical protein
MKKIALISTLTFLVVLMLASSVHAELRFKDLTGYVDGKKDSGASETGGTIDNVEPESKIKFKVEMENTFSDREINGVTIEATLKDIDDGEDLDDESDDFDLDPGDDKRVTFEFDIPLEVEDGSYTLELYAEGNDNTVNRTKHNATLKITVEVEKEKHKLHYYLTRLTPESVSCGRPTELEVGVINLGREDEDDVRLEVSNSDLELQEQTAVFELDEGANDDDVKTVKRFKITTSEKLAVGTYPIQLKTSYNKDSKLLSDSVDLIVTACEAKVEPVAEEKKEDVEVNQNAELLQQLANLQAQLDAQKDANQEAVPAKAQPPVTLKTEKKEEGFLASYGAVVVVGLYLLVIAAAGALLMIVFKKKEE